MPDREKVIAWLTEISLRPCDFATDDFDSYETERLANDAIEIVNDAEIFCKQRNDALSLLKEQEEREKRICKTICDFIRGSCSTDTYADKEFVCHEIQKCFMKGR